jgi:phosphatidylserine decarboxylase
LHPWLQYLVPKHILTKLANFLANIQTIWIKDLLINYFIHKYQVNLSEAIEPNYKKYTCFNDFFTRALRPETRPIASSNSNQVIVSPADGTLSQIGKIKDDQLLQAKQHLFSLEPLLGNEPQLAQVFKNGLYATIYLAPKDYHRIHMPLSGQLEKMLYIPGKLFSVNTATANYIPNLFAKNERVINIFKTEIGKMAVILVGAMIVGSIETVWAGSVTPPRSNSIQTWDYKSGPEQHIYLNAGEELGKFKLGSTVIVLLEQKGLHISWSPNLNINSTITMGSLMGESQTIP